MVVCTEDQAAVAVAAMVAREECERRGAQVALLVQTVLVCGRKVLDDWQ